MQFRNLRGPLRAALAGLILLGSTTASFAQSTHPDITGVWTGKADGSDFSCSPPTLDGPFSDQLTVTFSNQNNPNFDVSVSVLEQDGTTSVDTGSGFFTAQNQLQFTLTSSGGGGVDTTTVFADVSGSQMTFTFSGSNTGGDFCNFSGNGTVTRSGGNLAQLNPATEAGSTVTNVLLFNTQLSTIFTSLGTHIGSALRGAPQGFALSKSGFGFEQRAGLNAGDGAGGYGLWGNYTYTDFDNDLSSTAFDGHSHSLLGGIDFSPFKNTVLGVAAGLSFSDVDTTFNRGNQENTTITFAPYLGAVINDNWSVDASFGFSTVSTSQFRTAPGTTTQISSNPDSTRWFGSINLNGVTYYNNWILGARAGVMRANNNQDSFAESNGVLVPSITNSLGTLSIGANVAYSYGNYEPFASLTYENDYRLTKISVVTGPQPANDRDDFLLGLGVRYYGSENLSGSLEWNRRLGRANFDEDIFSFSLRADF